MSKEEKDTRTVRIHDSTHATLYDLKKRGETYDDVIRNALSEAGYIDEED